MNKKIILLIINILLIILVIGCQNQEPEKVQEKTNNIMTVQDAMIIAQNSDCTQKGTLTTQSFYNENSKTWWITLEMKKEFEKKNCNPVCVVYEINKTAEINWRCTGISIG